MNFQTDLNVVLFCGGRGSASIIQELLRRPSIQLTLIVNAYDDGLSTGALRNFISEMLGPSDFRKNLSYLLNPFSEGQYALKSLLEFRLPISLDEKGLMSFKQFIKTGNYKCLFQPLKHFFSELSPSSFVRVHQLLKIFIDYSHTLQQPFNFADCSIGNLIFAGAYLEQNKNFNAAAQELSHLTSSRARLVNVSNGENRILVALKENGEILTSEAQIVSKQSASYITNLFFLKHALDQKDLLELSCCEQNKKEIWLKQCENLPILSSEAENALNCADMILFGPGTQHSSLYPSYRIAYSAIQKSSAKLKIFVMNLEPDHDIQTWSAQRVLDQALFYLNDVNNHHSISHVLIDKSMTLEQGALSNKPIYKNAFLVTDHYANDYKNTIHNGRRVIETLLSIKEYSITKECPITKEYTKIQESHVSDLELFIDINTRSLATEAVLDEFFEIDWKSHFSATQLTINLPTEREIKFDKVEVKIKSYKNTGPFPEIPYFIEWLKKGSSEYLVLLTGDGEYRFRDVMLAIQLLKESHFGAVFGSRTQSRLQFRTSIHAAYREKKLLSFLSFSGGFLMSALFALRYGIIFSDPLTGFRVFSRARISHLTESLLHCHKSTPTKITQFFIRRHIEIAEIPVNYKTFSGFTDPYWRVRRGLKNLLSIFL